MILNNGHTLAMRKTFRDEVVPTMISNEGMRFDDGLATVASLRKQYYILHEPLVRHRIHEHNNSTKQWTLKSRIKDIERQIASREGRIERIEVYVESYSDRISDKDKRTIDDFLKFMGKRVFYLKERKLFRCIFQTLHYNPINDWKFLLTDIFCIVCNRYTQ